MPLFLRGQHKANRMLPKFSTVCWLSSLLENTTTTTPKTPSPLFRGIFSLVPTQKGLTVGYSPQCLHCPEACKPGYRKNCCTPITYLLRWATAVVCATEVTDREGQHYSSTWIMSFFLPTNLCLLTLRQICTVTMPLWHKSSLYDLCYGNFFLCKNLKCIIYTQLNTFEL